MLAHLLAVESKSGRTPDKLRDAPELLEGTEYLWGLFTELHGCRGNTGFGPARITYSDIHSYEAVTGIKLAGWELQAIRRADGVFLTREAERAKREQRD